MRKLTIMAGLLLAFSGCGKNKADDALGAMEDYKTKLCACKDGDVPCAKQVMDDFDKWAAANKPSKDMSDEQKQKFRDLRRQMDTCQARVRGAAHGVAPVPATP